MPARRRPGRRRGQFCLALLYGNGTGVEQDDVRRGGAKRGRPSKRFFSGRRFMPHLRTLGEMYRVGMGVPRDHVAAYKWLDVADRLSESLPAAPTAAKRYGSGSTAYG